MKYESTFSAIDKILWNEAGCSNELDYIEQTSWLLFLKYLDDLETDMEFKAELENKTYKRIITGFNRWSSWAAPKKATGEADTINAMTGDDLVKFVNEKLFPALAKFKETARETNTLEYKIGEIFSELRNKIQSGYNLREVINKIDTLHFQSAEDKHEMSVLYEDKIKRMGNAGRNGGEYYTPRPLIRSIIKVVDPKIGETVYDPACGSAGFLCEAFNYMQEQIKSTSDNETLQKRTFVGKEKKPLPYIIATMNMIFHGVAAPNITRGNTLSENLSQIQERDRHNVILANPPFGGAERQDVQQNFPIKTSETAYMFMQHFVKMLKAGGRAGIVIKNTFLSNGDAAELRKMLLEEANLHTILDVPQGAFMAGVRTVVLFFEKGQPTKDIWYYQLNPGRKLGKTSPLTEEDMAEFIELQKTRSQSPNSWLIDVSKLGDDYDLAVRNPNRLEVVDNRTSETIAKEIEKLNQENAILTQDISLLQKELELLKSDEEKDYKTLADISSNMFRGSGITRADIRETGFPCVRYGEIYTQYNYWFDECVTHTDEHLIKSKKYFEHGDILFAITGESVEEIGKSIAYLGKEKCLAGGDIVVMKHNQDPKYLAYALATPSSIAQKGEGKTKLKVVHTNIPSLKSIRIPLPSLSRQKLIAEKMDQLAGKIKQLQSNYSKSITLCEDFKQALLKETFE